MKQLSIYDNEFIGDFDNTHQANRAIKQTTNYLKLNISPNETDSNRTQVYDDKPVYVEQNEFPANVTEIVLTKDKMDSIQLILPMLINLHQKERWLAWIDPPIQLLKEWQKQPQSG